MSLTAVICAYWVQRIPHIERIIRDLYAGTVKPDQILVLNNNSDLHLKLEGAKVLNSQENFRCRAKYVVGLLYPTDYYLMMDDDTSVGRLTIEQCLKYARRGCCFGYLGVTLTPEGSFHNGGRFWPDQVQEETPCDTFCGCGMFMAYDSLVRALILEERLRLGNGYPHWPHEGDDIIAGLANRSSTIPMPGEARFVDLGHKDTAMSLAPGYYEMRDRFTLDVLKVRREHPIPDF